MTMSETPFAVGILTPSTGICRIEYAQCLGRLLMYFSANRIFEDQPNQIVRIESIVGSGIAGNYQQMVLELLNDKEIYWTHFLSIEDDMAFAPECLHILARRKLDIVGANYSVNKGYPLRFTTVGLNGKPCITTPESTGIEEVSLLPQGFTLVSRKVYETLELPWFLEGYSVTSGRFIAQDYHFSEKAREAGFKIYVDHDCSKLIGHIGYRIYTHEDALRDVNLPDRRVTC